MLDHGRAGARDSFAAAQPSVLRDGATWQMWYEGDDSNQKSIAYATSPDGITWSKGGAVIVPGSGTSSSAPSRPVAAGLVERRRLLDGGLSGADTASSRFAAADFNSPDILEDPGAGSSAFKLYYSASLSTH